MLKCIRLHAVLACAAITVFILAGASAADKKAPAAVPAKTPKVLTEEVTALQERVTALELEITELKAGLAELRASSGKKTAAEPDPGREIEPKAPGTREKLTEALFKRILDQKMTEADVSSLLGPGKASTRPNIPPEVRELVWSEGKNSITVQFTNGRASGGISEFSAAPEGSKKRRGRAKSETSD